MRRGISITWVAEAKGKRQHAFEWRKKNALCGFTLHVSKRVRKNKRKCKYCLNILKRKNVIAALKGGESNGVTLLNCHL